MPISEGMTAYTRAASTLGSRCREWATGVVNAEILALVDEHAHPDDIIIYTDGSVRRRTRSSWAYSAQRNGRTLYEDCGAFETTTSSMTMEITAASRALSWVAEQQVTHTIIISDSMNMLQLIESGSMRVEWVDIIRRSHLKTLTRMYTPA